MPAKINFYFQDVAFKLLQKKRLRLILEQLFTDSGRKLKALRIIFCDDSFLLQLNKKYLNHDYFTDILTFDFSSDSNLIDGELYISLTRVQENSVLLQTGTLCEVSRVMFHGALHLVGYSDNSKRARNLMTTKENYYLKIMDCST